MHSIVKHAFSAIMISLVMFIVVGVVLYIGRMYSMKHKVDALASDLRQDIVKNHYLSDNSYDMYQKMLEKIKSDDKTLVDSIDMNYGSNAHDTPNFTIPSGVDSYGLDLHKVSNVGDIKIVQIHVRVRRVAWGSENSNGAITKADDLVSGWVYGDEYFNYIVPCQRYIK